MRELVVILPNNAKYRSKLFKLTLRGDQLQIALQQNQIDILGEQMFPFLNNACQLMGRALRFLGDNKLRKCSKQFVNC